MKFIKLLLNFFMLLLISSNLSASVLITVSANGSGNHINLKEAHDAIPANIVSEYHIVLNAAGGDILLGSGNELTWEKSGTQTYPIKVYSINGRATVKASSGLLKLIFKNVQWIEIKDVNFESVNPTDGIMLDNADNITLQYNKFLGSTGSLGTGGGALWIGKNAGWSASQWVDNPVQSSEYNNISYNYFDENFKLSSYCTVSGEGVHKYHGIYISRGNKNNDFIGNTIVMPVVSSALLNEPVPIGSGILLNNQYLENNVVENNLVYQSHYNKNNNPFNNCGENSNVVWGNLYDKIQNSRYGIYLAEDAHTITGNIVDANYLSLNPRVEANQTGLVDETLSLRINPNILANSCINVEQGCNYIGGNHFFYDNELKPHDPFWLDGFNHNQMKKKFVSGDFDGDGKVDDIAVFADGDGSVGTEIHVWTYDVSSTFTYQGVWRQLGGYDNTQIEGRVVSGDFDQDGFHDDIAVFYRDWNPGEDRINLFLGHKDSQGTFEFIYKNNAWPGPGLIAGYSVEQITDRVVSGDFDRDGYHDDIAVFYQDWNPGQDRINLFKGSSTGVFTYSNNAWASTGYSVEQITGRVVSGDFDGNGYHDDIAVFYQDWNPGEDRINLFKGNGVGGFIYSNNAWPGVSGTGYSVEQITNRVISGDFDEDGYHDDIAVFYQDWNPGENRINLFKNNGASGFTYNNHFWPKSANYDFSKVSGLIVSGNFNQDSYQDDIVAFYDYGQNNLRSHVWVTKTGVLEQVNEELGYPWLTNVLY